MKPFLPDVHAVRNGSLALLLPMFVAASAYCQYSPVNAATNTENASSSLTTQRMSDHGSVDVSMLKVYPNPVIDETSIVFNAAVYNAPYELRIINNSGIVVRSLEGRTSQGQNTVNLQLGDFAPGNYYVQITTPSSKETLRFLK